MEHDKPFSGRAVPIEPLWTIDEVAAYLRVSVATVRRWTNNGQLPCYRLGDNKQRRFSKDAVLAFVETRIQRQQVFS